MPGDMVSAERRYLVSVSAPRGDMPDVLPSTLVALFVACSSCCIFGTVGGWMPYYLSTAKHWSTQEYSAFYVCWGIVGFFGLWLAGWLADRIGRRVGFVAMLMDGAILMTLWVYTDSHFLLSVFGLAWSFGFLGFWGPSTTLTAEVFPTRIRRAATASCGRSPILWGLCYGRSSRSLYSRGQARSRWPSCASPPS
jgi:predicted MFS family arabinose efflux permease